jgi:phospholipid/cholesterol/gamma-HCH transport system permease protein
MIEPRDGCKGGSWPDRVDSATVARVLAALGRFAVRPLADTVAVLGVPYVAVKARVLEGRRGLRLTGATILRQVYFTAVEPFPVFAFIAVVVSAVLLLAASALMEPQGLAPLLPAFMAPVIVREVTPLLLGLVLVARTGTAVTTEIGTLRVTHELDAFEASGLNVDAFVVLPRVLGLTVAGAALMVLTGLVGLLGGASIAAIAPQAARVVTVEALVDALSPEAIGTTALKGASFGFVVACIACRHGLAVERSAREIAVAGARATLQATLACFLVDALYTLGSVVS